MEKRLQKIYLTYYSLLTAQNFWQAHYQILSIIFLKKPIDTMIKKCENVDLNISIATVFLNTQILKMI